MGKTWRKPVTLCTASRKRNHEGLPAYDSSPATSAAHCSADMAPVPESVSRSMSTSCDGSRKTLYEAVASADACEDGEGR